MQPQVKHIQLRDTSFSSCQLAFGLLGLHMAWSGNVPGIHGMQEVRSSNLLSYTKVICIIRKENR